MLDKEAIRRALHADQAVPLGIPNPHGPLGLEHLAAAVEAHRAARAHAQPDRVSRPLELPTRTWEKLHALAAATSRAGEAPVSAAELAAVILEEYVLKTAS